MAFRYGMLCFPPITPSWTPLLRIV